MASDIQYFVYILASRKHGTLYIGMTNDILRRAHEHREGLLPGFTRRYGVKRLVTSMTASPGSVMPMKGRDP
jgi:predicted GIY-YIG superfamily endonuclease